MFLPATSVLSILLAAAAAPTVAFPRLAPRQYATPNHGLTFRVPKDATYCPLSRDWVGSDHGTTIFLERPRRCGGAGYPSGGRDFEPENIARLDLYYGYSMREDEEMDENKALRPPCRRVARVPFLGATRAVCEERKAGFVTRSVKAYYEADTETLAVLTLVTRPERLRRNMATFAATAASFRTCRSIWHDGKKSSALGYGSLCPRGASWF